MFATYNGDTPLSYHEKDEVAGFEARLLLSRRRTCTVIDRAGAIYGSRQTAKRTSAGRTRLSMLCARLSVAPLPMTLVSTRNVTLHIPATIALITTAATKISPTALVKYEEIRSKENEGEEVSLNVELQLRQSDYRKVIWKIIRTWNGDTPLARGVPFYARPTRVPRRGLFHP